MATTSSQPVCFDATGTLIETAQSVGETYHRVALEYGVDLPAWRIDDAFRRILKQAPPRPHSHPAAERAWWFECIRQTFQATDSTARFADFEAFASRLFDFFGTAEAWRVRPGMRALLERLTAEACPMAIVSNFDHRLPRILEELDLKAFFVTIEIPSESSRPKPDRSLFAAAAERLACPVERLQYVGDDAPEVLAAIACLGVRVFDIREIDDLEAFPTRLASPATLPGSPSGRASPDRDPAQHSSDEPPRTPD